MFLLASALQETETGEPSASTATASNTLCYYQVGEFRVTLRHKIPQSEVNSNSSYGDEGKPREQVAANPRPATSSAATFASEHADFTAVHTASQISVDDCWCAPSRNSKVLLDSFVNHAIH